MDTKVLIVFKDYDGLSYSLSERSKNKEGCELWDDGYLYDHEVTHYPNQRKTMSWNKTSEILPEEGAMVWIATKYGRNYRSCYKDGLFHKELTVRLSCCGIPEGESPYDMRESFRPDEVLEWIKPFPKDLLDDPSGAYKALAQKWGRKGSANIAKGTTLRWNPETPEIEQGKKYK